MTIAALLTACWILLSFVATLIIYAACCVAKCHDSQHGRDEHMDEAPVSTQTAIII